MTRGPVIALIDGEHHPPAVREVLDRLDRERGLGAVVFCGGEEKVGPSVLADAVAHYGRDVLNGQPVEDALRALAGAAPGSAVVDLADEPVLAPAARLELAALALHLGLSYEAPGLRLEPPRYAPAGFDGRWWPWSEPASGPARPPWPATGAA